jgi:hypothetical protein
MCNLVAAAAGAGAVAEGGGGAAAGADTIIARLPEVDEGGVMVVAVVVGNMLTLLMCGFHDLY